MADFPDSTHARLVAEFAFGFDDTLRIDRPFYHLIGDCDCDVDGGGTRPGSVGQDPAVMLPLSHWR